VASRGRPKPRLTLSPQERDALQRWARRRTTPTLALRSRIVLACADDADNRAVAESLGVTDQTVGKWRFRFVGRRLDGLIDDPRPGAPRKITDDLIEQLVTKTIEEEPAGERPWSARSMAKATGLSHSTVLRIWNAHGIRAERSGSRRNFTRRVGQIVPLYRNRRRVYRERA